MLFCPSFQKETFSLHLVSNCQLVGVKIGRTVNNALDFGLNFGLDFGLDLGVSFLIFYVFRIFRIFFSAPGSRRKKIVTQMHYSHYSVAAGSAVKSLGEWCTARNTYLLSIHF